MPPKKRIYSLPRNNCDDNCNRDHHHNHHNHHGHCQNRCPVFDALGYPWYPTYTPYPPAPITLVTRPPMVVPYPVYPPYGFPPPPCSRFPY